MIRKRKKKEGEPMTRLEQHIADGDYFGNLATHLDIAAQTLNKELKKSGEKRAEYKIYFGQIIKELVHLQNNYTIVPKKKKFEDLFF